MSEGRVSPLLEPMVAEGGVVADHHGRAVVRHLGDPAGEYRAAMVGLAVFDRSHRVRMTVSGRAPRQMLDGILTGTIPAAPDEEATAGVLAGRARYSAVLTSKGKMITDLWALLLGDEETDGFLLDVPIAGAAGLTANFAKFLPPRLATAEDVSESLAMISVVGPDAAPALARLALGSRVDAGVLLELEEGAWRAAAPSEGDPMVVVRTRDVSPEAFNVLGATDAVLALWQVLLVEGATAAGLAVWSTLRVEAGRPAFGTDMDQSTIPVEAGIDGRAIDHGKGCYTGQEVIVRIRDRGHVNRHLRRLRLGDVPAPTEGTELFAEGSDKPVGWITSAVESPEHGGVVALAYVRRGVEVVTYAGREVTVPPGGTS